MHNKIVVVQDTIPHEPFWDGSVKNLIYDTMSMSWIADTGSGGGGGDASAANQLTEIDRLETIIDQTVGLSTADKQDDALAELQALNSLIPSKWDYFLLSYTGEDLTTAVFKIGGSGGTTVATISLTYSGGLLQSGTVS